MASFFKNYRIKKWKVYIVGDWEWVSGAVLFKDREPVKYPEFGSKLFFHFKADGSFNISVDGLGTMMFGHYAFDGDGNLLMTEKGQNGFATRKSTIVKCDSKSFICKVHDVTDKTNPLTTMVEIDPEAESLVFTYRKVK